MNSPSCFPPRKDFPASLARRANGISSGSIVLRLEFAASSLEAEPTWDVTRETEGDRNEDEAVVAEVAVSTSDSSAITLNLDVAAVVLAVRRRTDEGEAGGRRSEIRLAREQRASDSMPENALRRRRVCVCVEAGGVEAGCEVDSSRFMDANADRRGFTPECEVSVKPQPSCLLNLSTSSSTSSSQRLSLSPSEARMRISSARTGRVKV